MKHLKFLLFIFILLAQVWSPLFAQEIKVACIGNSITYGSGLDDRRIEAYPIKLEGLLNNFYVGKTFKVENYGVPGATMLKDPYDGDADLSKDQKQWSYWEADDDPNRAVTGGKERYDAALAYKPDIVIIKFGTNDARSENWRSSIGYGKNNFYDHYVEFINSFKAINPNVTIYICYSLPSFKNGRVEREQARIIREEVIPTIKLIARKNKVHLIDLHSVFQDKSVLLEDGIHPNAEGAALIANEVFEAIKMNLK